jgi:hypothetical protein
LAAAAVQGYGGRKEVDAVRVELVDWPADLTWEGVNPATLVGQADWCFLIPHLHRALASAGDVVRFPRLAKDCSLTQACAYWETAVYLLNYLLGWRRAGEGLRRWYRAGRDDHGDDRLRLLQAVWNDRDQLDLLAAWYWRADGAHHQPLDQLALPVASPPTVDDAPSFPGAEWWESLRRRHPGYGVAYNHDPLHGGTNPLHLGHSNGTAHAPHDAPGWIAYDAPTRRAVLMLDVAAGWYAMLARIGATLPDLGAHSWHVDVVVRPIGWLGTFRRSRVTGLWFQGKHSIHMMGQ